MNKKKGIIIGVLAIALVMVVGYALFSDTLTINGTATAQGDFDMQIISAEVTGEVGSTGATAQVNSGDNNNSLTINIPKLEYPGAYVDVTYKVKNAGSVPALYDSYEITGETDRIKAGFNIMNMFYEPEDETQETIRIYWDENNNTTEEESVTITFKLNYVQTNDKESACASLKEFQTTTDECVSWILFGDDCPVNKYDLNHDTFIDAGDVSNLDGYINLTLQCPSE